MEKIKVIKSQGTHPQCRLWKTKKLETVEYFTYLDSMVTNDARCTHEIKSSFAMATQRSTRRRIFSPAKWT